jgi:hypothetical protein
MAYNSAARRLYAQQHDLDHRNKQDKRKGRQLMNQLQRFDTGQRQHAPDAASNAVQSNGNVHHLLDGERVGERQHCVLEPHCDVRDARVLAGCHSMQSLQCFGACDYPQAGPLRIASDDARHRFHNRREEARIGSGNRDGQGGRFQGKLLGCAGGDNPAFRQEGSVGAAFSLGEVMGADNDPCSCAGEPSDTSPDLMP